MIKQIKKVLLFGLPTAVLVGFIFVLPIIPVLSISERKNSAHKVYSRQALQGFVISYTHSVNKGRVHDYYTCSRDGMLTVDKTIFVSYGAGIPEAEETPGAIFKVTDDGYEISGLHRSMQQLVMAVGVIAEHSITVDNREVFLKTLFVPQTSLVFKKENVSLLSYMATKKYKDGFL